jgi:flagellin
MLLITGSVGEAERTAVTQEAAETKQPTRMDAGGKFKEEIIMVVQHNMQAMNANRMLNVTTNQQAKSTEKLSSGYKINRAADDAAGLSISEKMRKQIRGLDQASTNAEDGVSAVQTAEGALTEVHSMLQRMNELAVQASNGTNSESDRQSIQDEISQLTTEIDRVAETTKFNESYLLKGGSGTTTKTLAGHDAGITGTFVDGATTATLTVNLEIGSSITIGGVAYNITKAATKSDTSNADEKDGLEHIQSGITGLTTYDADNYVTINGTTYKQLGNDVKNTAGDLLWSAGTGTELTAAEIAAKIKDGDTVNSNSTNVVEKAGTAEIARDYTLDTNITQADAKTKIQTALIQANSIGADDALTSTDVTPKDVKDGNDVVGAKFTITKGTAEVVKDLSFDLHVGADADMTNKITVNISTMGSKGLGISGLNVADDSGMAATYAIDAIADAISTVSAQRSALGAVQNRLEHTINNLDNVVENTTSAESRIRDTDMAEEMVNYSKNNILSQAGQSMLAQANQSNQGVLSLLG